MMALPKVADTKRTAVMAAKAGRSAGQPVAVSVPDHITDVKAWVERVYGYEFIEVKSANA